MRIFRKKSVNATSGDEGDSHGGLNKVLSVRDLTFFGIAAIIGAGSFSSMGQACASGGPAVIYLFIICGVACGFTALCYAEFASRVPVSGSAYTYAYVSFGELFAWIIGWALLMEYSIGNIYVAFSWSGYFTSFLDSIHIGDSTLHIKEWLTTNYLSAHEAADNVESFMRDMPLWLKNHSVKLEDSAFTDWLKSGQVKELIKNGGDVTSAAAQEVQGMVATEGYIAWNSAPKIGGLRIIFDLPAVVINAIITILVIIGVKESRNFSNLMVILKLFIVGLIIFVGFFYVDIDNWNPFMPNGFGGVMGGVAAVFFAYIGFDAVSTLAEESKNPQRDLPRGMIYSLVICTVVYIILSLVLTGMVTYDNLNVSDPLASVFQQQKDAMELNKVTTGAGYSVVKWMLYIISIAAVVAMTSVLLVFQMGHPIIWISTTRDGLLPKKFATIIPKNKTPVFSTIMTGLVVGIPLFFTNETFVLDFTSIGTLFAFILVCGGVLTLPPVKEKVPGKFHLPYINGRFIVPALLLGAVAFVYLLPSTRYSANDFVSNRKMYSRIELLANINDTPAMKEVSNTFASGASMDSVAVTKGIMDLNDVEFRRLIDKVNIPDENKFQRGMEVFAPNIPMWAFVFTCLIVGILSFVKRYSLIPVLGLLSCSYLLTGMAVSNWMWFGVWLAIGLVVYFSYGYRKSKLANSRQNG